MLQSLLQTSWKYQGMALSGAWKADQDWAPLNSVLLSAVVRHGSLGREASVRLPFR
jgi:hypothetical protein